MKKNRMIIQTICNGALLLYSLVALIPFIILVSSSFSSQDSVLKSGYAIWPKDFSFAAYKYIGEHFDQIFRAYSITIIITILGTFLGVVIVMMIAYPLSRKDLPGRKYFLFFIFFTMLFNGGLLPTYFMYVNVFHVKNTFFALLFPTLLLKAMYIFMMKTFFASNIPDGVIDSAQIDGANELQIFYYIIVPMGKTIVATVGLFIGIGYWNDWYNGMLYLTETKYFNFQNLLTRMMTNINTLSTEAIFAGQVNQAPLPSVTTRMAIAVIGVIPIIILFPFVQKFFIKGIALGSVKE